MNKWVLRVSYPVNTKHLYNIYIQHLTKVEDKGPMLYQIYANVLCLLGNDSNTFDLIACLVSIN